MSAERMPTKWKNDNDSNKAERWRPNKTPRVQPVGGYITAVRKTLHTYLDCRDLPHTSVRAPHASLDPHSLWIDQKRLF